MLSDVLFPSPLPLCESVSMSVLIAILRNELHPSLCPSTHPLQTLNLPLSRFLQSLIPFCSLLITEHTAGLVSVEECVFYILNQDYSSFLGLYVTFFICLNAFCCSSQDFHFTSVTILPKLSNKNMLSNQFRKCQISNLNLTKSLLQFKQHK